MRHQHSVADSSLEPLSGSPHVIDLDLLDLLPCAAAIWALKEDTATLNPQAQQLFAVVNGEEATVTAWTDQIHPQDRSIFTASRRELLSGLKRAGCDYRFFPTDNVRPFGSVRYPPFSQYGMGSRAVC